MGTVWPTPHSKALGRWEEGWWTPPEAVDDGKDRISGTEGLTKATSDGFHWGCLIKHPILWSAHIDLPGPAPSL